MKIPFSLSLEKLESNESDYSSYKRYGSQNETSIPEIIYQKLRENHGSIENNNHVCDATRR